MFMDKKETFGQIVRFGIVGTTAAAIHYGVYWLLQHFIEVNIADLHLEQTIHVRNLPKLEGIEYKTSAGEVVASCVNMGEETEEK